MAKLVDPDSLNQGVEVVINTSAKTIQLLVAGNLNNANPGSSSGVTLQCVYSFLKEEWKTDALLNKFKFPLKMFTKTDGIFINGWTWADATTRNLIRDAGWEEITGAKYAGIISLGNFDATTDQAWYQNTPGYNQGTINFNKTGNLNEAISISGYTVFLKNFLRIRPKLYAEYDLLTEQTISALEPVLYKLPLSNSTDLKIVTADANIDSDAPYTSMNLNYLKGKGFTTWANTTPYVAGSVVKDNITGRWKFSANGGTSNGTSTANDIGVTDWQTYDGEQQIGSTYYAFNRVLMANNGTDGQCYNWAQRQLRKTTDINANNSPRVGQRLGLSQNGTVAELLVEYVGDTLKTKPGLIISGFNSNSTNSMKFRDITVDGGGVGVSTFLPVTSTERAYPFVAAGNINFSSNLVSEPDVDTKYAMYFTVNSGGNFDSSGAIIVKNNAGALISGLVTAASIAFDFDYDNNVQGIRTSGTDAFVSVVAQGLAGATWVVANSTITRSTGQSITVNADDERNYNNPV